MIKKNCLKILLILALVLFTMCMFNLNSNVVYAADEISQEYLDNLLNIIPNTIELDISEKQVIQKNGVTIIDEPRDVTSDENLDGNKALKEKITSIFNKNNIDITTLEEQDYEIYIFITEDLEGEIYITDSKHTISSTKMLDIIYNNSDNHNIEEENQIIDTIKNNIPQYYLMTIDENGDRDLGSFKVVENYYSKILNDSSITLNVTARAGDFGSFVTGYTGTMQVFKDDLFCGTVNVCDELFLDRIIIPENIEDTSEAYIQYSLPIAQKAFSKYMDGTITLKVGYDDFNVTYKKKKLLNSNLDNIYTVYENGSAIGVVILEKEKSNINLTDTTTNIKLETDTSIISSDVKLVIETITSGDTYNNVEETLKDNVSKMYVYDISLESNGVKVQPSGKVKISIPIPENFDKSNLAIYRIEENGTKIKYEVTVEDNYAVFETDHFSTYVLAQKTNVTDNTEQEGNQNATSEHIKDETPKTGTENNTISVISSILSVISIISLAIVKRI